MSVALERELEEAVVESWPAAERQPLDGWLLRASGGPTHRGNSVATLAAGTALSLTERLSRMEAWYQARGQPAQLQVGPCVAPPELDSVLEQRGYRRTGEALVMTASAVRFARPLPAALRTSVEERPGAAWRGIAAATSRFATSPAVLDGFLARLSGRAWYATAWLDDAVAPAPAGEHASAMALGIRHGRWLGVYAMHTRPDSRRRGAGRALLHALAEHALRAHIQHLYLLVEADNAPARALYAGCGFQDLYAYHYRVLPEQPPLEQP
jgi:GNAT superfamily N-acetyltransferase